MAKFEFTERGRVTERSPEQDIKWEGETLETKADTPLVNDGSGKATVLRRFDFALPPGGQVSNLKLLLKQHRSKIIAFLWKDELELIQELRISLSGDLTKFHIFALCQAKKGSLVLEKPLLLQTALNPYKKNAQSRSK